MAGSRRARVAHVPPHGLSGGTEKKINIAQIAYFVHIVRLLAKAGP